MGYEFHDFGQQAVSQPLSIRSIIDGRTIDYYYGNDGFTFTTVSVSGRGNLDYTVESAEAFGRHGALQRDVRLNPRKIVIRAFISARSNEDYRRGMSKINAMLHGKKVHTLRFTDDPFHTYYGTIVRVEDEGEKANKQFVEYEFICNDPFKYTEQKTVTTAGASKIPLDTDMPIVADRIEIKFGTQAQASDFVLMNTTTGKRITFKGNMIGSSVLIIQRDDYLGTPTGQNRIDGLNITYSDFDTLKVDNDHVLHTSPAPQSITVTYRGAKL